MKTEYYEQFARFRFIGLVLIVATALFLSLLPGSQQATADPAQQGESRGTGRGTGEIQLPAGREQLAGAEPIQIPLTPNQWTTLLSENFESTWPTTGWEVFDNDNATHGEYYWANRCPGRNSSRSAWSIGGGVNGSSLSCGAVYPHLLDSWATYGPVNLSQATDVEMDLSFWLNSECVGANCADKRDRLWVVVSTDGTNFTGWWWAGNWYQDPRADPNGWVTASLDL